MSPPDAVLAPWRVLGERVRQSAGWDSGKDLGSVGQMQLQVPRQGLVQLLLNKAKDDIDFHQVWEAVLMELGTKVVQVASLLHWEHADEGNLTKGSGEDPVQCNQWCLEEEMLAKVFEHPGRGRDVINMMDGADGD